MSFEKDPIPPTPFPDVDLGMKILSIQRILKLQLEEYYDEELIIDWLEGLDASKLYLIEQQLLRLSTILPSKGDQAMLRSLFDSLTDLNEDTLSRNWLALARSFVEGSRSMLWLDYRQLLKLLAQIKKNKGEDRAAYVQALKFISILKALESTFSEKIGDVFTEEFVAVLGTPGFEEVLRQLSAQQLLHLVRGLGSDKFLSFLSAVPEFIPVWVQKGNLRKAENWPDRLENLDIFSEIIGIHFTTDEEVNQVVLQAWAPQSMEEKTAKANFSHLPVSEQRYWIHRLRNGMNIQDERTVRAYIRAVKEQKSVSPLNEVENEAVRYQEHPDHPNRHFYPTVGYEIESSYPTNYPPQVYDILASLGFQLGDGNRSTSLSGAALETSPDPAYHPQTLVTAFSRWQDAGLLDIHQGKEQTMHYNVGLHSGHLKVLSDRLLLATHWAYRPQRDTYPEHRLAIYYNSQKEDEVYMETKGYFIQTPEGFKRHLYYGSLVNVLLLSYERAVMEWLQSTDQKKRISNINLRYISNSEFGPLQQSVFDLAVEEFSNFPWVVQQKYVAKLGAEDQQFFFILMKMKQLFQQGLNKAGLELWQNHRVPAVQMNKFVALSRSVFPEVDDQYDEDRVKKFGSGFTVNGRRYANIIDFSRQLTEVVGNQVATTLAQSEVQYYSHLKQIRKSLNDLDAGEAFVRRYPWLFSPIQTMVSAARVKRIEELIAFAEEFGKL